MSGDARNLQITIMGREFRVACKPEEEESLREAVDYLNIKMQEIKEQGKVIGHERIAIMAALNISHEYLTTRVGGNFDVAQFKRKINLIERMLDEALVDQNELF
jgi:cell division protein ZapA